MNDSMSHVSTTCNLSLGIKFLAVLLPRSLLTLWHYFMSLWSRRNMGGMYQGPQIQARTCIYGAQRHQEFLHVSIVQASPDETEPSGRV